MSQQYLFEGWTVHRTEVVGLPGYGKVSVNPEEPEFGLEALFPGGRIPEYHDQVEYRGLLQVAHVIGGSAPDKKTGASASDFTRTVQFVPLQKGFEIISLAPYHEESEEQSA